MCVWLLPQFWQRCYCRFAAVVSHTKIIQQLVFILFHLTLITGGKALNINTSNSICPAVHCKSVIPFARESFIAHLAQNWGDIYSYFCSIKCPTDKFSLTMIFSLFLFYWVSFGSTCKQAHDNPFTWSRNGKRLLKQAANLFWHKRSL